MVMIPLREEMGLRTASRERKMLRMRKVMIWMMRVTIWTLMKVEWLSLVVNLMRGARPLLSRFASRRNHLMFCILQTLAGRR